MYETKLFQNYIIFLELSLFFWTITWFRHVTDTWVEKNSVHNTCDDGDKHKLGKGIKIIKIYFARYIVYS